MEAVMEADIQNGASKLSARALIADDQPDVIEALRLLLKNEGHRVSTARSPQGILDALAGGQFDFVLMDLNYARDTTSGREGLDLVERIHVLDPLLPIVVMTAWSSVPLAVEAMRRGVRDFVEKPWENNQILSILRQQVERVRTDRERERQAQWEDREIRSIERSLLPRHLPQIPGYEIAAVCQPTFTIGGDYFGTIELSRQAVALCVADVSGKGMPAALLMSNLQAAVRISVHEGMEPAALTGRLNSLMRASLSSERFITFFCALLDTPARRLRYTNAGHNAPILLRGDGSVANLGEGGTALGMFADPVYEQSELELKSGDRLILFTDGLTEATDPLGREFGEERLVRLLIEERQSGAEVLKRRIIEEVTAFCEGRFHDDVTLIVLAAE